MLTSNQLLQKGRYRVINSISNEQNVGFYTAYDTVSNANVVLRESAGGGSPEMAGQVDSVNATFMGEAKELSDIRHEALLSVRDYFSEIDRHYVVMESVDGPELTALLDTNEKRPPLSDVLGWADQLLEGLNYLHTRPRPFIHRDVRPGNIRLTKDGRAKLLTAGLEPWVGSNLQSARNYNGDDVMLHYRPLEQLWNGLDPTSQKVIASSFNDESARTLTQPLDARCDLYSLAATLYHVVSGALPDDALERSIEILEGNPDPLKPLSEIQASVPAAVSEVIMKALSIKREDRFASAAEMYIALKNAALRSRVETTVRNEKPKSQRAISATEDSSLLEVEHFASAEGSPAGAFEWSEEDLYKDEPSKKEAASSSKQEAIDADFSFAEEAPKKSWLIPAMVAVVVLVAAVAGFLMMSGGSKTAVPSTPPASEVSTKPTETQPSPQASQPVATESQTKPEAANSATEAPVTDAAARPATEKRTESPQVKAAKPAPAKPTEQKKKVTVDDLINDN